MSTKSKTIFTAEQLAAMTEEQRKNAAAAQVLADQVAASTPTFLERWGTTLKGVGIAIVGGALGYGTATYVSSRKTGTGQQTSTS